MKIILILLFGLSTIFLVQAEQFDPCDKTAIDGAVKAARKKGIRLLDAQVIKREMAQGDVDLYTVWGRDLHDVPYEFAVTLAQSEGPCRLISLKSIPPDLNLLPVSGTIMHDPTFGYSIEQGDTVYQIDDRCSVASEFEKLQQYIGKQARSMLTLSGNQSAGTAILPPLPGVFGPNERANSVRSQNACLVSVNPEDKSYYEEELK